MNHSLEEPNLSLPDLASTLRIPSVKAGGTVVLHHLANTIILLYEPTSPTDPSQEGDNIAVVIFLSVDGLLTQDAGSSFVRIVRPPDHTLSTH